MRYNSLNLGIAVELAKSNGGFCLSTEYKNNYEKLKWKCGENHVWDACLSSIQQGSWCPICSRKKRLEKIVNKQKQTNIEIILNKYKNKLLFPNIEQEYLNKKSKITVICIEHNKTYKKSINQLLKDSYKCPDCIHENNLKMNKKGTKHFTNKVKNIYGDVCDFSLIGRDDVSVNDEIMLRCKEHNVIFKTTFAHLFAKNNFCPECSKQARSLSKKLLKEEFFKNLKNRFPNIEDEFDFSKFEYIDSHTASYVFCKKCKKQFKKTPNSLFSGTKCPICQKSNGERLIEKFLNENNFEYKFQYRIKECRNKKPLPFDFAIFEDKEKTKLKCLIEFDGKQHFEVCDYFKMTQQDLERTQKHDKIKTDYCLQNNIKLIRIPYWEKNNISSLLTFI